MSEYNIRYRPQKISELDLVAVREGLTNVLNSGKIPHAFLFTGPRGIGKTSAARIVAKAVNCKGVHPEPRTRNGAGRGEPCNACSSCLSITAGTNLDVLEIDAASNRGIDDIRDLREKIKLAPSGSKYKVYIIDEVHMLTPEAFNALLKTLEEPPRHAIFILCTTQPEKLPETIISRCLRFHFKRATQKEILDKLEKIVGAEELEAEPEALKEIAKAVKGSFRDANKVLEQASFSGQKITAELVKEVLGQTIGLEPEKLLVLLGQRETRQALVEINRVVEMGGNLRVYTEQILELLRGVLLAKVGVTEWETRITEGTENLLKALKIGEIKRLIEIFSQAAGELREAVIPQLPLELAIVEWCEGESVSQSPHSVSDSAPPLSGLDSRALEPASNNRNPRSATVSTTSKGSERTSGVSLEEIQSRWPEVLLKVRPKNYSLEALLRATRPVDFSGKILTLEVFYQFHKDKLETEKCRRILEEVVAEIFGTPFALKCVLGTRKTEPQKPQQLTENVVAGNGETTDEDILKVAEEIFGTNAD